MRTPTFALLCIVAIAPASRGQDFGEPRQAGAAGADLGKLDIPLTLTDVAGVERRAEVVSTGVPLPVGLLTEPTGIAVFDPGGRPVPAQFAVLERWREFASHQGSKDQSIKWLLVTFLADVPPASRGQSVYRLRAGQSPAPAPGRAGAKPADGLGPFRVVLTNPDGQEFTDAELKDVKREVVESGPVRACVKLESPTSHEKFGFLAWVYTYATGARCDATIVLKNTPNELVGPLYLRDFSVTAAPQSLKDARGWMLGGEPGKTFAGELSGPVCLYQDSDGTDRWDRQGTRTDGWAAVVLDWSKEQMLLKAGTPAFRGYRVMAGEQKLGEGDFALGWAGLTGPNSSALLAVRHFRENYPIAAEVQPGRLIARLLPKQWKGHTGLHWLDDSQRKRWDLSFREVDGRLAPADGDAMAMAFNMPLVAHCGPEWYRASGAVGFVAPDAKPPDKIAARPFPCDYGAEPGWVVFGGDTSDRIRRRYHQYTMDGFIRGGDPHSAYRLMIGTYHSSGMTPLWLDDYQYPRDKAKLSVAQYCSTARGAGKYSEGTGHHGYKTWNMAHFCCQELFDGWRLFGDPLALDAIRQTAVYQQFYVDYRAAGGGSVAGTRSDGHPLSNLAETWRITGDRAVFESLKKLAAIAWRQADKLRGNYGTMPSWEGGNDLCEKPFMMSQVMDGLAAYHSLTHDETTADLIVGMTDFILAEAYCGEFGYTYVVMMADPAKQAKHREEYIESVKANAGNFRMQLSPKHLLFCWRHTGEARYRDALATLVEAAIRRDGRLKSGYAYLTAALAETRPDAAPPEAVKDLACEVLGGGKVRLSWTTPADAARLQVKHASRPMVDRIEYPRQAGSHANWWAGENVDGEPAGQPGRKQSMVIEKVPAGTRCFAIRSFDAASNRSGISNVVSVQVR